ncbi:MAG: signal transduction histidine kinase/ActR/RegA family two-component response regulator [Gammaproteobacteria bacterium]|jgi:signal transduction histidine kinase/ActR/RegA family two-component response regulator
MKTKQLLILFTFISCFCATNAQVNIDSLKTIWNNSSISDSVRLDAVNKIALLGFRFQNPDSAFYYSQLQLDFAKSIGNKNAITEALNNQGDYYLLQGNPDKALTVLNSALKIAREEKNQKAEAASLGNIARVFDEKGDVEKSLEYLLQILEISEEIGDKTGIGKSLGDIGENYVRKGNLTKGFEFLNRSKKIFEELNDAYSLTRVRSFMANIYMQQQNPEEALSLLKLNLNYFEETGNKTLMAGSLSNIAGIYGSQGKNKEALIYLEKALPFFEETNNIPYIAKLSQNMARIYHAEGRLEEALASATKGLQLARDIKNKEAVAFANRIIALIHKDQEKHEQAITYGNEALVFFEDVYDVENIKETSYSLVESYKATGNYKKALEMNDLYIQMRDSLNSQDNQNAIMKLQIQTDFDKQKALDDLKNEKEIALEEQKTKAQFRVSVAIGIGFLIISLLALIIFNRLKLTRKQKLIIEEQKEKVEQSEKYKQQFLANMSHEIRTPMHAISGMTKILERNPHPQDQDVYLKAIQTSSDNLVVILNDVLDLSKIEAGKLEIENISMNLESILENVFQIFKFKAEEKGVILSYRISEEVPELVMGDPTRLNQILINLVGNAIKFTEKGKVELLLQLKNNQLNFQVTDTGIGIPTDKQKTIFGAFEQAKSSTNRYYGGTGLGLSISKQLVELQNGKIGVQSIEDKGSTFFFELPLTIPEGNTVGQNFISKEKLKMMTDSLKGIRVLIAEDNPFNQMIAQDDLTFFIEGIQLVTVENGALAVDKFEAESFDVILMDVQMPQMNGFEATKAIRAIEKSEGRTSHTPIIAMTASLLKTEIDSCYSAGMNNYIPKPYKLEELIIPLYSELRS